MQGKCNVQEFDNNTQALCEMLYTMIFMRHDRPIEAWFAEQEGITQEDLHNALKSHFMHPVRFWALHWARVWVVLRLFDRPAWSQVLFRAGVMAVKNGKELTTAVTPYNSNAGVNPASVAFYLACFENYIVMKCSAPGHCRRSMDGGGEKYGPAPLPRARASSF